MKKIFIFFFLSIFIHSFIFLIPLKIETKNISPDLKITLSFNKKNFKIENTKTKKNKQIKDLKNKSLISKTEKLIAKKEEESEEKINEYEINSLLGPKILGKLNPKYPLIAKKLSKEGEVKLKILISEFGEILSYEILKSDGDCFLKSVLEELKKVTFIPAKNQFENIKSYGILLVKFKKGENYD